MIIPPLLPDVPSSARKSQGFMALSSVVCFPLLQSLPSSVEEDFPFSQSSSCCPWASPECLFFRPSSVLSPFPECSAAEDPNLQQSSPS